ncbi:uncharacterized protein [Cicer arietinum]|uniref:Uncharacterized protein LOC101502455 n=1 Tax=Cicer arietinum TaxID=3827 RepID=A0A1S2Y409_CICAR|nr:uncharacterized protein LOC101502455 [Cicer arietinum]
MNTKDHDFVSVSTRQNLRKHGKVKQHNKKQVRRRLHTTRPYQEKLLNMAEARREIVSALKFHRATMKQANEKQEEESLVLSHSNHSSHLPNFEQDLRFKSKRYPRIYPSCTTNFSYSSFSSHPSLSLPNSHSWPLSSSSFSPPLVVANTNFTLPNHTLGLNLSLDDDFNNLEATFLLHNNNNNSSLCSYSSQTSSSPPLSLANDCQVPSNRISQGKGFSSMVDTIETSATTTQSNEGGFHASMDDEGMEEMRSIGEQYQMEWNDTMNFVTSTLWFNFLKKMEHDVSPQVNKEDDACHHVFDELFDVQENYLEEWSEDYFLDLNFPW